MGPSNFHLTVARLVSLPTVDTIKRLRDILSQPPIRLDPFETFHVTVARSYSRDHANALADFAKEWLFDPDREYLFKFTGFDYLYDDVLNASKLVGTIECPALDVVHQKSENYKAGHKMVMQFLHAAPPLSNAVKSFVVSIADTLIMKEASLPFTLQGLHYVAEKDYVQFYKSHYVGGAGGVHYLDRA